MLSFKKGIYLVFLINLKLSLVFAEDTLHFDLNGKILLNSDSFFNNDNYILEVHNNNDLSGFEIQNEFVDQITIKNNCDHTQNERWSYPNVKNQSIFILHPHRKCYLHINVINKAPYNLPLSQIPYPSFFSKLLTKANIFGIYSGFCILFFIYSLIFVFVEQQYEYLFYSSYLLFTYLFYMLEQNVVQLQFYHLNLNNIEVFVFAVVLSSCFTLLISCYYFIPSVRSKLFTKVFKLVIWIVILLFFITITKLYDINIAYPYYYKLLMSIVFISYLMVFFRTLLNENADRKERTLFMVGYTVLFLGVMLKPISFMGFIEYNVMAKNGAYIGQFMEMMCLSGVLFLRYQNESRSQVSLSKELNHFREQALLSQMNPHFIFNAISSIQYFINKNNVAEADEYLSRFANLIRKTLDNSRKKTISLAEEIEMIKLYSNIEERRFNHKFVTTYDIEDDIEEDFIQIPPMLIQPLLENAINHGLLHLQERPGLLHIHIYQEEPTLLIEVIDNGIGLKSENNGHRSLALTIINERIQAYQRSKEYIINFYLVNNDNGVGAKSVLTIQKIS